MGGEEGRPGEARHGSGGRDESPEGQVGIGARGWPFVGGLVLLLALPLVVVLAAPRGQVWYPTLDHAMFELLVRDVGGADTPLLGAYARVVVDGEQGSHLGPVSIYLMWPVYRLFGATSWALQVATVWVHLLGIALSVTIAHRRGGARLAAAVALVIAALEIGFGPQTLTTPWNPYLAIFWWLAFVLAIWSVIEADHRMLPVSVLAGSVCVQNHLEYLGLVAGLGALALAVVGWSSARGPRSRWAGPTWRALGGHIGWSVGVGVVLWLPTLWQEITRNPGNLSLVRGQVSDPSQAYLGLAEGFRVLLRHLDPSRLASGDGAALVTGSVIPGALLVAIWVVGAVVAARIGPRSVVRLDLVVVVVLVVGGLSMGRYQDEAWPWLGLWATVLGALLVMTTTWTAAAAVRRWAQRWSAARRGGARFRPAARRGLAPVGLLLGLATVAVGVVSAQAWRVDNSDQPGSRWLAEAVPALVAAIDGGSAVDPDRDPGDSGDSGGGTASNRRYAVGWRDPVGFGARSYGLLNELDRRGYDVTTDQASAAKVGSRRDQPREEADAVIQVVVGGETIEAWREAPGAREVVVVDQRTAAERAEYERLEVEVIADLRERDLAEIVEALEVALYIGVFDPRVPPDVVEKVGRMLEIGQPSAIFIGPPGAGP